MERILFIFIISFILYITPGDAATQNQMVCPNKFQPIGRFCYHFSDETKNWKGARKACKKMGDISSNLNVMLATLDVTGIPQDNQDLLSVIKDNNNKYWLGGQLKLGEGDKARWRWLDNRPIQMTANYWRENSPNNTEGRECLSVSKHSVDKDSKNLHTRASVIDKDCSKYYRYVCQAACPKGFQLIGKYCYFFSSENKVSGVTWDDARKYCQGKSADLAVMGLDNLNDQKMLDIIANAGKKVYMGASDRTKDNSWFWLDGRPIPLDSYIWAASAPQSSATHDVIVAKVISSPNGDEKAVLEDATSTEERHFVCQLLYTPPFGQMYIPVEQVQGQMIMTANGQIIQQPQLNSVPAAVQGPPQPQLVQTADGRSYQILNPKGQMEHGQAATWPPNVFSNVGGYPQMPQIIPQIVASPRAGPPGVWPQARAGAWPAPLSGAVPLVQTVLGVPPPPPPPPVPAVPAAPAAPAAAPDSKVEELLQAILDAENDKEENATSVGKKQPVKKETNDVFESKDSFDLKGSFDTKDSYDTLDTFDTSDSYDTDNTDFNNL